MKLYEALPDEVEYNGRKYRLCLDFRRVLAAMDALADPELSDYDRADTFLSLLVEGDYIIDGGLISAIGELLKDRSPKTNEPPSMDIEQDWEYIVAGFQQAYNIDLLTEDMHYLRFVALLKGLPNSTRLADIMKIRTMDVPAVTKYNAKQVSDILKLKAQYVLRKTGGSFEDGLNRLFDAVKARAQNVTKSR